MPLIAGMIGYLTKRVAVEMMFRPLEFVGIPPFLGWQGVVPRSAARMAATAVDLMLERLLDPQEILDRIDIDDLIDKIGEPMHWTVDELAREVILDLQPALWEALPETARRAVIRRVEATIPGLLDRLRDDLKRDVEAVLDIRSLAIHALIRDKALTVKLIRTVGRGELRFIVRVGFPFGLALGTVQAGAWALTHSPWIMPVFGGLTGLFTDWLALQMIFRPVHRRALGPFGWQGLFHARRQTVQRDYSELMAKEILTPANVTEELLTGPSSDRFFRILRIELDKSMESVAGVLRAPLQLAVGSARYTAIKSRVSTQVLSQLAAREDELSQYADVALDLRGLLAEKMQLMTDEEFEGLLRPAFKQDEWKLIAVGAVLGVLIGELQLHLLLS